MKSSKYKLIELTKITDGRGNLSFIESRRHVPFNIKRLYFIYNVPNKQVRGRHAHKSLHQLVIAISGSFTITLDDGLSKKGKFILMKPNIGLYIPPMVWREMKHFSDDAVCLCLVSEFYDEDDYVRDYDDFINLVKKSKGR